MKPVKEKKMKALIVRGGWDGHEPVQCSDIFAEWLKEIGCDVVVSDSLDAFLDKAVMSGLSVIIPAWTMGTLASGQSAALRSAVSEGVGLAGWHGGMCDAFRNDTSYQFMTGGQFVAHPGGIIKYRVNFIKPGDPLVRGLKDFYIKSEQYYMHVDPGNDVLAETTISGKHGNVPWVKGVKMPVVWKRRYGKGRVFYSALGHVAGDFKIAQVLELTKRGILWAANSL